MRLLLAPLLLLAAAVGVSATDYAVPPGQFADLKYKVEDGDKVMLTISPAPVQQADGLDRGRFIFAGKDGTTYTVRGFIVNFKAERLIPVEDTVVFAGKKADPAPDPKPAPGPDPKPTPVAGTLYLAVVHEASDRTPDLAAAVADLTYWSTVAAKDVKWRVYDKDAPDLAALGYLADANKVGLPAALVYDKTGKLLAGRKVAGRADIDATLKEVGR